MPKSNQIIFAHKELVTIMIKDQDIHEGWWGLYVKFGIQAANVGPAADLLPAAIVPILEIGLQKFEKETNLSVDAAKVYPVEKKKLKK